jgi:hypothetical protein
VAVARNKDKEIFMTEQLIAANPGYVALEFEFCDLKASFNSVVERLARKPVVAWRIGINTVTPVAIGDVAAPDFVGVRALLLPGGTFVYEDGKTFTMDVWIGTTVIERWRKWRDGKNKVAA